MLPGGGGLLNPTTSLGVPPSPPQAPHHILGGGGVPPQAPHNILGGGGALEGGWGGVRGGAPWPGCGAEPREKKSLIRAQLALKTVKFRRANTVSGGRRRNHQEADVLTDVMTSCLLELGMEGGGVRAYAQTPHTSRTKNRARARAAAGGRCSCSRAGNALEQGRRPCSCSRARVRAEIIALGTGPAGVGARTRDLPTSYDSAARFKFCSARGLELAKVYE